MSLARVPDTSKGRDAYIDALVAECYRDAEEGGFEAADIDEVAAEATDGEDLLYFVEAALERAHLADVDEEVRSYARKVRGARPG